jgi:hypothetical protein
MLALLKKVVCAIAVAKVIKLPRLSRSRPTSHYVLIDQNPDSSKVACEVACIGIGLGEL